MFVPTMDNHKECRVIPACLPRQRLTNKRTGVPARSLGEHTGSPLPILFNIFMLCGEPKVHGHLLKKESILSLSKLFSISPFHERAGLIKNTIVGSTILYFRYLLRTRLFNDDSSLS